MGDRFGTPGADGFLYIALFLRESQSQSESESQRALGKARPGVAVAGGAKVGGIAFPGLALPKARLSGWQGQNSEADLPERTNWEALLSLAWCCFWQTGIG
jgi:hypothetical protein